jgi:hypothetical protein
MPAQIRPTRLEVSDRFPMLGFNIRADEGSLRRAEVAIGADPGLFGPEGKAERSSANFYSTRGGGQLTLARGEGIFVVPPEVLSRFVGQEKLYFGLATAEEGDGAMKVAVMPDTASPYISLRGLTGRSLQRVRMLPNRQQRAAGYGGDKSSLDWAGDMAAPGMQPARGAGPVTTGAPTGPAPDHPPAPYDDGFGPLPPRAAAPQPAATDSNRPPPPSDSPPAPAQGLDAGAAVAITDRRPVTPPPVRRLEPWQRTLIEAGVMALTGPLGMTLPAMALAARAGGVSIGFGPAVGAGLGAGATLGAGLVFGPDGGLGVYGSAEVDIGFITSISATMQITVVRGGIESFNGWSLAATVSGGEGVVGGASALFDLNGNFQGVSVGAGIGAGFSPVDFYIAIQRQVATQLGMAAALGQIPEARPTQARAMTIDSDDVQRAQRYAPAWRDLFNWAAPASIGSALAGRGMSIQRIQDAYGALNLDRYEVRITTLPNGHTAASLFDYFRKNINEFVDTRNSEFIPYDASDAALWASDAPFGAVMKIDIAGPDNAAVVTSLVEPARWRFTTVTTPWSGEHPVSGHREFGYRVEGDTTIFYTRGSDRATDGMAEFIVFGGADHLWTSFQTKLVAWVGANGGAATAPTRFSERFHPQVVQILYGEGQALGLSSARALSNDSFTLNWDEVQLVAQPTDLSCWAAAAAMVVGWKDQVSLTPETIAAIGGRTTRNGLNPAEVETFAGEIGLTYENPQSYTVDGFRRLIADHGPLWVGAAVPGLHAIVVTGLYSDGDNTFVRISDPWDRTVGSPGAPGGYLESHSTGSRYILKWEDFVAEYERAATDFARVNLQILHAGSSVGRNANTGASTPVGYAQSARALSDESFTLNWDEVQLVAQPTELSCWAAAAAMVVGWRDRISLTPDTVANICRRAIEARLPATQFQAFAGQMGLSYENPACYTVEGFRQLLANNGPLWVAADVPGLHAIVVTGLYSDGANTFVRISDPWDRVVGTPGSPGGYLESHSAGSRYILKWEDFVAEYERTPGLYSSVNLQILHSGSSAGRTANTGATTPAGYAQAVESSTGGSGGRRETGARRGVDWSLAQYEAMKQPATQLARGAPIDGPTIDLADWPYLAEAGGETSRAGVTIDWKHDSGAVGAVRIAVASGAAEAGRTIRVEAEIADGQDTPTVATLVVTIRYTFSRTGEADSVAVVRVTLHGDGRHERSGEWLAARLAA